MANTHTKTVGYVRVSTTSQNDIGLSIEVQTARIKAYALALDLDLVAIVEDAGASAKSLNRPGLRNALAMLDAGQAEALLVVKLDRLTRSVRDLGDLVERYFARQFRLLSVSEMVDTGSAAGRLVLNVLTSVAQWEREATGERTRDAMAHKKAKGEFTGGNSAPYGYAVENGKLVPVESEQEAIRVAKDLQNAGLSRREIAKILDQKGIRSRSGKVFDATQIARMVATTASDHLELLGVAAGGLDLDHNAEDAADIVDDVRAEVNNARCLFISPPDHTNGRN